MPSKDSSNITSFKGSTEIKTNMKFILQHGASSNWAFYTNRRDYMDYMNSLIPLMVIIPITCALFLNLLHERDRTIKVLSVIVHFNNSPTFANYGTHYFGGYAPLIRMEP